MANGIGFNYPGNDFFNYRPDGAGAHRYDLPPVYAPSWVPPQQQQTAAPSDVSPQLNAYLFGGEGGSNGVGGGQAGLGVGIGNNGIGATADTSNTTTSTLGGFLGAVNTALGITNPVGMVAALRGAVTNTDPEESVIGGIVDGLMGHATRGEVNAAMNSPAFGGGTVGTDPSVDTSNSPSESNAPSTGGPGAPGGQGGGMGGPGGVGGTAGAGEGATGADGSDMAAGGIVEGIGGGQEDNVPAQLSVGEYVIPADVVSALGDGNNDAGASKLDQFLQAVREHKAVKGHPPKAKGIGSYMGAE